MTKIVFIVPTNDGQPAEANVYPWLACNLVLLEPELAAKGEQTTLIYGESANPANCRTVIIDENPARIYLAGHGWPDGVTVEQSEHFMTTDGLNLDLVANKVVHCLSCYAGTNLGPTIIEEGAKAFFGYKDTFMLMTWGGKEPCSCRFLTGCFEADLKIERKLTDGITDYKEVRQHAIDLFNTEIEYWEEHYDEETCGLSAVTAAGAEMLIDCIIHDRDALVAIYSLEIAIGTTVRANIVITNTFSYAVTKDLLVQFGVYNETTGEFVSEFESVKTDVELGLGETIGAVECVAASAGEWDCLVAIGKYDAAGGVFDIEDKVVKKRAVKVV